MRRYLLLAVLSLSVLLSTFVAAQDALYTFTTLDVPVPDTTNTLAYGINAAGQIVGYYRVPVPRDSDVSSNHGFLKHGDTYITIDAPNGLFTRAYGINDVGQIVGVFRNVIFNPWNHGFLTDGTTFTAIDVPDAMFTEAHGINAAGQIVGYFRDAAGHDHGFLKHGDTYTTIDVPDAMSTLAYGINAAGQIVGYFRDAAGHDHGFLKHGDTYTTLDVPDARPPGSTLAFGINAVGQIVGVFGDATGVHGFRKDGDTYTTLDVPDARPPGSTWAFGINAVGQIVGVFQDGTTPDFEPKYRGFLATPEPPIPPGQQLASLGPATLWIGLKNSDDQGTAFDLQAEVAINSAPVATARMLCLTGVTRNPDKAIEEVIPFGSLPPVSVAPGAVFSLTIRARIGTNPDGTKCPGHSNAVGVRLYYDATSRPSRLSAQLTSDSVQNFFLHSSSNVFFLDESNPTATTAKFRDSAGLNFAGGNPWKDIGTWSMTLP